MSAFPSSQVPSSLKISSIQPTLVSTSHSLQRQVRSRGGHRWAISVGWENLSRGEWAQLFGFSQAQRGQFGTFTYVLPANLSTSAGVATGTPLVKGALQAGRSILTDGWTASIVGIMKAGDFVKFSGHAKVYMLTADVTSDISGNATLAIEPALFATPSNDEAITTAAIPFSVSFTGDSRSSDVAAGMLFNFSADMIEAV